jgi:hypothetical protein
MSARKKKPEPKLSHEELRQKLKLKHLETKKKFSEKFENADKFLKERGLDPGKIREHSGKILGAGAIAGTLLLNSPHSVHSLPAPHELIVGLNDDSEVKADPQKVIIDSLKSVLPERPRPLTRNEEKLLEQVFENVMGIKTRATLEGEHLNTTYGVIGAEQHLARFPGDTLSSHENNLETGMAPGRGAWGYFAESHEALTPELVATEKWYAVVQTLYLPDWNSRQPYLKDWYKYRKVIIVNKENARAVVASIADSGPAAWTGKHFGGSPEVMNYLGGAKYKKGPVVVFFVDDPENKIPLGPIEYNQ